MASGSYSPSALDKASNPKRQKLVSEKVCIVLNPIGPADYEYYIYIVDLNEKSDNSSLVRRSPDILLNDKFPSDMAFAVVNSTLYMFGGHGRDLLMAAYSFPLLSPQSYPCDVSFPADINTISPMNRGKRVPRAVLIGGQICVFSCFLDCYSSNFELYDPDTGKWSSMPDPPIDFASLPIPVVGNRDVKLCEVDFYCVENLILFISTVKGSYFIDFGQPRNDHKWVPCNLPLPYNKYSQNTQPVLKDGKFLFTPSFNVYDLKNTTEQPFSISYLKNPTLKPRDQSIFLLPNKGTEERLRACIFETGGLYYCEAGIPNDSVLGFYLFQSDDANKLTPSILNSTMFYLDITINTYDVYILGVFPM